jgi:transcriptional regulator with XRE-family HTH domain
VSAKRLAGAFGAVLREARRARGLSQEQVAEFAEFDRTYPSLLERGLREPGLSAFVRLAAAVKRSPHELLDLTLGTACPADGTSTEAPPSFKDAPVQPAPAGSAIPPVRTRLRGARPARLQGLHGAQETTSRNAPVQPARRRDTE